MKYKEDKKDKEFRSGFVAIIGRPNVGKSTFLNSVLGEKVSIVSRKPQTTRNTIRGVKHMDGAQIVFVDTPGLHKGTKALNRFMAREALGAIKDVDCILMMVEATDPMADGDGYIIEELGKVDAPVVLAINKIDKVSRDRLLPMIGAYTKVFKFKEVVLISATRSDGIDKVLTLLTDALPEGPEYFPPEMITDQPERFLAAEIVREKVFHVTTEEIPYSVAVTVEEFNERLGKGAKPIIDIRAIISVERDSQKGIIIGKGGATLKKIGTAAREELEAILGVKVFLEIHVKVAKGWTRNARAMEEFGYK